MFATLVACWLMTGVFGSWLFLNYWWRQNRSYPMDVLIGDVAFGAFIALAGPVNLGVGIIFFLAWVLSGVVDTTAVVLPARPNTAEGKRSND